MLTDARNALLLLAVTHVRYGMPHDKNKETKAYSRLIFLNLQPNEILRIIEHVQNATSLLTRRTNVDTHHNLSDRFSFQRSANGIRNLSEKQWQMMFFDFQAQKVHLRCRI